ncbi:MAG: hypothetical protein ACLGIN_17610 [Candidatus Sericytochromatia bacterium]
MKPSPLLAALIATGLLAAPADAHLAESLEASLAQGQRPDVHHVIYTVAPDRKVLREAWWHQTEAGWSLEEARAIRALAGGDRPIKREWREGKGPADTLFFEFMDGATGAFMFAGPERVETIVLKVPEFSPIDPDGMYFPEVYAEQGRIVSVDGALDPVATPALAP